MAERKLCVKCCGNGTLGSYNGVQTCDHCFGGGWEPDYARAQAASDKAEIARLVELCEKQRYQIKDWFESAQHHALRIARAEALAARYRADVEKLREALSAARDSVVAYMQRGGYTIDSIEQELDLVDRVLADTAPDADDGRGG